MIFLSNQAQTTMEDNNTLLCPLIAENLGMRGLGATTTTSSVLRLKTTMILSTITTMRPTTTTLNSSSPRISTTTSSATNTNKINTNPSESSLTTNTDQHLQPDTFELELADILNTNMDNEFDTEPMTTDENNKRHNTDSNQRSIKKPTKPNPVTPASNPIQSSGRPQTTPTPLLSNPPTQPTTKAT